MKLPVKLGFIGAGRWMQTYHLPTAALLRETGEVSLMGIWNKTTSKAEKLAKEFKISKVYASPQALMADPAIDGIIIAVSRQIAEQFLELALHYDKAVLIEKPPTEESSTAKELGKISSQRILVAFNRVFTPLFEMLKTYLPPKIERGSCTFHRVDRDDPNFVVETGVHALMGNDLLFGPGQIIEIKRMTKDNTPVTRWLAKVAYPESNNLIIEYDFHPWSDLAIERYSYFSTELEISAHFHQHYAKDDPEALFIKRGDKVLIYSTDQFELLEQQGYLREHLAFIEIVRGVQTSEIDLLRTARVMELAEEITYR